MMSCQWVAAVTAEARSWRVTTSTSSGHPFMEPSYLNLLHCLSTIWLFLFTCLCLVSQIFLFTNSFPISKLLVVTEPRFGFPQQPPHGLSCAASKLTALIWEQVVTSDLRFLDEKPPTLQEPQDPICPSFPALPGVSQPFQVQHCRRVNCRDA